MRLEGARLLNLVHLSLTNTIAMTDCTVSSGSSDAYTAFTHAEPSGIYPIPPSNIADAAVGHTQENSVSITTRQWPCFH